MHTTALTAISVVMVFPDIYLG